MRKILSFVAAMLIAFAANAQTDFAAPGYSCAADDAVLTGGSSSNFYLDQTADPHHIAWSDVSLSSNALATWTVTATRGCYVSVSLDLGPVIASNKHNFEVKILDANANVRGTVSEGGENNASEQVKVLADSILLPAAGVYTVELRNNRDWGKGTIKNVFLTYVADAPSEIIEVTSVVLNKTELALEVEEVEMLTATVLPENATDPTVTWTSSDPTIATVSDGFVTAVAVGTANITATAGNKSALCAVTVAATSIPNVDFIEPYVLSAKKAHLEGAIWKMYKEETYKLYGDGGSNKNYGTASWTIHVTKPCKVTGLLNGVEGGHEFVLDVFSGELLLGTSAQQEGTTWWTGNIPLTDTITFAAAGDYTLKLRNTQEWSSGKVAGVTLSITPGDPKAIYLTPAIWAVDNAKFGVYAFQNGQAEYFSEIMTLVEGETATYETTIPENYHNVVFLRLNNGATEVAWANMWNQTIDLAIPEGKDMYTIEAWGEGEGAKSYGTWSKFEPTPAPQPAAQFQFVTSADALANGDQIIITSVDALAAISTTQNTNNRAAAEVSATEGVIVPGDDVQIITLVADGSNFMLQVGEDAYLYAASNSSNHLKTANAATVGDNGKFAITMDANGIASIIAQGSNQRNDLRYNPSGLFSCYASNTSVEAGLKIFKKAAAPGPEPQGCDWNNIPFLGDGSLEQTYANQFKVCKDGDVPTVVNIQTPGFATGTGIYMTFPDAVIGNISLAADQYKIEGAGVIFYLTAFTAKETEVTVQWQDGVYSFTVLNVNGAEPQPEVNYSLKNNWDAAADWTWKEMTKDGDNYKLDSVVFGGTGVNYKADLLGAPEIWVPMADFLGDKVDAKDTVTFVLNPADSTITATLIGKYIEPAPEPVYSLWKVVSTTDTTHAVKYIDNEYLEVKTVYQGTVVAQNAVIFDETFTHAIQVRTDQYPSTEDVVGPVKAGSTPLVFTAKQDASIAIYYLRQAVNKAWTDNDNKDVILFDQAAPTVKIAAAKMKADSVLADSSYYFMAKSYNLQAGHTYTLTAKGTTIKLFGISYPAVPEPVHTYTVAGAPATLFGQEWAPSYAANDLEPIVGGEYTHGWKKDSVALAAGEVTFKIVEDHAWAHAWPAQNYVLNIPEAGLYNITILFNQYAEADSLRINAIAQKVGEAVVIPVVTMHGTFTNPNWATTDPFTLAADSLTASLKLNLEAKTYEFGMKFDGTWKANGANITREAPSACLATGDGNMHMTADQAGEYIFTYTFATQTLEVAYPKIIKHYGVAEAIAAAADSVLVKDDLVYIRGIVTKIEFKGKNFAKYGSACIYVADAAGAADTLEFYNCYSMNADTFKTSDPAFDATSQDWAQFNSVSDANGNTVALGDVVEAFGKYNLYKGVHQLNQGCYITEIHKPAVKPTTAPAAPTAEEADVMAIYCNHYTTNNLYFEILGWGGVKTWTADTINGTAIVYCQDMQYEFLTNWGAASYDMSAYKKLHADLWAPAASTIRLGIEALGVNDGGSGFKSGVVCTLAEGWNSIDIEFSQEPDLANYSFTDVKYIFFEWYNDPQGESIYGTPFGFANIYFYDKKAEGFENIDASVKAVKVLQNGQIFILRGDKVYTVTGQPIAK